MTAIVYFISLTAIHDFTVETDYTADAVRKRTH